MCSSIHCPSNSSIILANFASRWVVSRSTMPLSCTTSGMWMHDSKLGGIMGETREAPQIKSCIT